METWHYVAIAVVVILLLGSISISEHVQDCGYKPNENASFWEKAKHSLCMNKIYSYSEHNCNVLPYRIAHPDKCAEYLDNPSKPTLCVEPGVWGSVCDHMEYLRCISGASGEKHICSGLVPSNEHFKCNTSWCGCRPSDDSPKIQRDAFRVCIEKQCGGKPEFGASVQEWSKFNNCVNNDGRRDML